MLSFSVARSTALTILERPDSGVPPRPRAFLAGTRLPACTDGKHTTRCAGVHRTFSSGLALMGAPQKRGLLCDDDDDAGGSRQVLLEM